MGMCCGKISRRISKPAELDTINFSSQQCSNSLAVVPIQRCGCVHTAQRDDISGDRSMCSDGCIFESIRVISQLMFTRSIYPYI